MMYLGKLLIGVATWYTGLSNRARLLLASTGFVLLLGLSCYKLLRGWRRLNEPLPKADAQQIILPMQGIFRRVQRPRVTDRDQSDFRRLDSLLKTKDTQSPNY